MKTLPFSQKDLKHYLQYNKDTGIFTRNNKELKGRKDTNAIFLFDKLIKKSVLAFYYVSGHIPNAVQYIDGNNNNNIFTNLRDISHLTCDPLLTHALLLEVLSYNKDTGIFSWSIDINKKRKGQVINNKQNNNRTRISVFGKLYSSHILAWFYTYGSFPKEQLMFINGDHSDCRIDNLKEVSAMNNTRHQQLNKRNTSGITGVKLVKDKWIASIMVKGKTIHLGSFSNKEDAISCRKQANTKYGYSNV